MKAMVNTGGGVIVPFPFSPGGATAAGQALAAGRVMSYPTETSYALGGNAMDEALVQRIFALKGREQTKALLLLVDGEIQARELAADIDPAAAALMGACWPGPLTLVLRAGPGLPGHLRDERGMVALRHSSHPVVAELLRIGSVPLIGTSANRSGQPPALNAEEVEAIFGGAVSLIVAQAVAQAVAPASDAGKTAGGAPSHGVPSTVLDTTLRPFRVLREGAILAETLREILAARDFTEAVPEAVPQ